MKKYRVGIVGAGNIAQNAHLPAYMKREDVEITAIADLNLPRAQAAAEKFGIPKAFGSCEELLAGSDTDYIDICVWNRYHSDVAIAAAKAGKAILCEKPMAIDLDHALAMEKAVKDAGVPFMMAVPTRYSSEAQYLAQMVESGRMGEIYYAKTANMRRRGTPLGWFTDMSKSGGGPVIDIGVHCIDRIRAFRKIFRAAPRPPAALATTRPRAWTAGWPWTATSPPSTPRTPPPA